MPVPTSNISLADIQTEFGGSNPIGINEYYAGGGLVSVDVKNSDDVPVPTSGAISFNNFKGASAITSTSHTIVEGGSGGNALGFTAKNFQGLTGILGSCTPTTTIGSRTISGLYMYIVKSNSTVFLMINGNQEGSWWTYGTYDGTTFNRANCTVPAGEYVSDDGNATDYTRWTISQSEEPPFSGAKTATLVLYP